MCKKMIKRQKPIKRRLEEIILELTDDDSPIFFDGNKARGRARRARSHDPRVWDFDVSSYARRSNLGGCGACGGNGKPKSRQQPK